MSASIAQAERLGCLTQILILRADLLLGVDAIIVRDDITDGSSRAIGLAVRVGLLGQQDSLVAGAELEAWQGGSRCAAEGSLRTASSGPRVCKRQLIGSPEIVLIPWLI